MQRSKVLFGLAASAVFLIAPSSFGAFTSGNLIILTTGSTAAVASAVTLNEHAYNPLTGTFNSTPTLHPLAGIILPGTNDHDGLLHLSTDATTLVFGGYQASAGTAGVVASSSPRAIGAVDSNFNATVTPITGYTGVSVRSVVATDAKHFWTAGDQGTDGGQYYVDASGASPVTQTLLTAGDARGNQIDHGQLWSVSSSTNGGSKVGTGLPTSATTTTLAMGDNGGALVKSDVVFLDLNNDGTSDTAYTTDGKNLLGKWSFNGSAWSQTGSWTGTKNNINNINALEAFVFKGKVQLIAATQETLTSGGQLFQFTDDNGIAAGFGGASFTSTTPSPLFAAAPGTTFRGVVIVPEPTLLAAAAGSLLMLRRRRAEDA